MGFFRQEYWSGLPFPCLGHLPNPGIEPGSPSLRTDSLLSELPERSRKWYTMVKNTFGVLERNASSIMAPVLAPGAITKHHRLSGLYMIEMFPTVLEGEKSKTKVPADAVSGEPAF